MMVQSIQKQNQIKSTKGVGASQSSLQSTKQILSQVSQLQKQVTRIQNDIQRIRTTSGVGTKTTSRANIKPESKKSRSLKSTKVRRGRKSK
jgi:outer membrane murein-binding lipoprotein Lpp